MPRPLPAPSSPLNVARLAFAALLVGCAPSEENLGSAREAAVVCAGQATLKGVDVAHYDGDIDWALVAADGNSFGFAKATEGTTFTDPKFAQNWANMKAAGVVRGAYHFFHSNDDPVVEADFFLSVIGPLEPGDLPPTLDLEVTDGQTAATIAAKAIVWLDHVAAATGKKPILYSSKRVFTEYLGNAMGLDEHGVLWDAQWNVTCPDLPDTYANWAFWQTTDLGTVPGIPTPNSVDLDIFNGDLDALHALGTVPTTTTTSSGAGGKGSGSAGSTTSQAAGAGGGAASTGTSAGGSGGQNGADDAGSGCSIEPLGDSRGGLLLGSALLATMTFVRRRARRLIA